MGKWYKFRIVDGVYHLAYWGDYAFSAIAEYYVAFPASEIVSQTATS